MPKKRITKKTRSKNAKSNSDKTIAILALLLNTVILPGLGTIIAGKTKTGVWQIVLFIIGAFLSFILIGIPIVIAVWIWGIVSSITILKESEYDKTKR